ncbi:MAG: hypothetical protein OXU64_10405 [Gemmatimonadota bacterium]|nr:hypothetical protein [Gemmatimonadota bacterium]
MRDFNVRGRRRKERKIWGNALLASLLLHVLVFVISGRRPVPALAAAAAGPAAADPRAARGSMEAMSISFPPPLPLVPPAVPIPAEIEIEEVELDAEADFDLAALLGEPDLPAPPGLAGDGGGDGGSASEGLGGFVGPEVRGWILPPVHKELKKGLVTVWVFVDESGRVVADSTYLDPPTGSGKLNRQLISEAADVRFHPATRYGKPVAAWDSYTIDMR